MEDIVHKAQANNYRLGGIKFKQHLIQVVGEKKKNLLPYLFFFFEFLTLYMTYQTFDKFSERIMME